MITEQQSHRDALLLGLNMLGSVTDRLITFDAQLRLNDHTAQDIGLLSKALEDFKLVMELIEELTIFYKPHKKDFVYLTHEYDYWPKKVMLDLQLIIKFVESYDWTMLSKLLNQSVSRDLEAYAHFMRIFLSLIPSQIAAVS